LIGFSLGPELRSEIGQTMRKFSSTKQAIIPEFLKVLVMMILLK
jgi:hypothetical protein